LAGDNLRVLVQAVNKGDEPAFNVQAELRVGDRNVLAEKMTELPVNGVYQGTASIPLALKTPGSYPLVLVLHYTDANQYAFSALTAQTFVYRREAAPPLIGQVRPAAFARNGQIDVSLKNSGDREIAAETSLVVPGELTAPASRQRLTIPPRSEQSATFTLSNFAALAGSTYQLFAVTEFEDGGIHFTSLTPGTVRITAERGFFGLSQGMLTIVLTVLAALFIGAQFSRRGR
jgi:hypothetical protein